MYIVLEQLNNEIGRSSDKVNGRTILKTMTLIIQKALTTQRNNFDANYLRRLTWEIVKLKIHCMEYIISHVPISGMVF